MNLIRSWIIALALGVLLSGVALSDATLRVNRPTRLLTVPNGQRLKTLHPPEVVTATGGKRGDYIRVRDEAGAVGWVYAPYLSEAPAEPAEDVELGLRAGGTEGASDDVEVAKALDPNWEKPAPESIMFRINGESCGPLGSPGDSETNRRKNRVDLPSRAHAVTFEAVDELPYPVANTSRAKWSPEELAAIAPFEGEALTVIGYLVALRPQAGSKEACNCFMTGADETDWHMALVGTPGQPERDALVVETTPRIRTHHPGWTTSNLTPWIKSDKPIRVTGWLLMDPVHKGHLGRYRNTLWEIHPITRIEVMKDGQWIDLDTMISS